MTSATTATQGCGVDRVAGSSERRTQFRVLCASNLLVKWLRVLSAVTAVVAMCLINYRMLYFILWQERDFERSAERALSLDFRSCSIECFFVFENIYEVFMDAPLRSLLAAAHLGHEGAVSCDGTVLREIVKMAGLPVTNGARHPCCWGPRSVIGWGGIDEIY